MPFKNIQENIIFVKIENSFHTLHVAVPVRSPDLQIPIRLFEMLLTTLANIS